VPEVHQVIPTFAPRSAVGNHTIQVQQALRELGYRSDIYVGDAWREVAHLATRYREAPARPGGWLLYQASTGSPIADWLVERPERLLLNWHNITPASTFAAWEPHVGVELQAGRRQIAELAPHVELAISDSAFNDAELVGHGYRRTTVVPILLDAAAFEKEVDDRVLERLRDDGATWLFVGRIAPNKAQHDLVQALSVYRRVYDPRARLRLIGSPSSARYLAAVEDLRSALQLDDAVEILGDVSDAELGAHYRAADVYVSASEHEGFGVPLLEAMANDVPVVAYGSTAVPETVADGGICLPTKEPTTLAAAVHRVVSDGALRDGLVAAGRRRLADFDLVASRKRFADAVREVVEA
jgi:glycosyltransferase involved in cell wall biosynthesis